VKRWLAVRNGEKLEMVEHLVLRNVFGSETEGLTVEHLVLRNV
jgi:hypothetical protein